MASPTAYQQGGFDTPRSNNFLSYYDALKPDVDPQLYKVFGKQKLNFFGGMLEYFGAEAPTSQLEYRWYEEARKYPKIRATNAGAGAAGASVTFTLAANASVSYGNASPYDTSVTPNQTAIPVRENDIIEIKPATGTTASSGNYIQAFVTSVNKSAGTFAATPLNDADSIPSISTADEIIIIGNASGEFSTTPDAMQDEYDKYTSNLQIIRETWESSNTAQHLMEWVDREKGLYMLKGEDAGTVRAMNKRDLTLLLQEPLSNTALANSAFPVTNPGTTTRGLVYEFIDRGNVKNYNAVSGLTLSDLEDHVVVLQKAKAGNDHIMMVGPDLDLQLDRELRDVLKNGAIQYGSFSGDQDKTVDLGFTSFKIGSTMFHKRCLESFVDLQTTGASGYGYSYEGFHFPTKNATIQGEDRMPERVPTIRMRYLASNGKSRAFETYLHNGLEQGDTGKDFLQVRYIMQVGFQLIGANTTGYFKRS